MEQKYTITTIDNGHTSYHYLRLYQGDPVAVVQAVATTIRNDQVDQCYEHMLTRIIKVENLADGKLAVTTRKNLYAGD